MFEQGRQVYAQGATERIDGQQVCVGKHAPFDLNDGAGWNTAN